MAHTLSEWRSLGATRTLLGRSIFAVDSGEPVAPNSGAPILCLHGFPSASWDWTDVWDALTERHRVIAFDFLGFGLSDKPRKHRYTIAEQADLTEALESELGLDGFHVLAHDYGDTVAQELLARQNSRSASTWRSLCLLNGGLFPETHRPRLVQKLLVGRAGPLLVRFMRRSAFERSFSAVFGPSTQPTRQQIDVLWELLSRADGVRAVPSLLGYMPERRANRPRWVGALQQSCVPLSVINGSADPVSGAHMVARFREVVGSDAAHIVELPAIGHYPQLEDPETVAREVLAFFARHDA
jgi:pimeloyl-ACP methyl ester carboxylesterase